VEKPLRKRAFPILATEISESFQVEFLGVDCLSSLSDRQIGTLTKISVHFALYHGPKILENKRRFQTEEVSVENSARVRWESEKINTEIPVQALPRDTRIGFFSILFLLTISFFPLRLQCFQPSLPPLSRTVFLLYAKYKEEEHPKPIAWVNVPYVNFMSNALSGRCHLKMWPFKEGQNVGSLVGVCAQNPDLDATELSIWFSLLALALFPCNNFFFFFLFFLFLFFSLFFSFFQTNSIIQTFLSFHPVFESPLVYPGKNRRSTAMQRRWNKFKVGKGSKDGSFLSVNSPLLQKDGIKPSFNFNDLPFYLLAVPWHNKASLEVLYENLTQHPLPPKNSDIALRLLRY